MVSPGMDCRSLLLVSSEPSLSFSRVSCPLSVALLPFPEGPFEETRRNGAGNGISAGAESTMRIKWTTCVKRNFVRVDESTADCGRKQELWECGGPKRIIII